MTTPDHDRLTRWLTAGDPTAGDELTATERTRLRAEALDALPSRRPLWRWSWALVPTAAALLMLVLATGSDRTPPTRAVTMTATAAPSSTVAVSVQPPIEWPDPPPVPGPTVVQTVPVAVPPLAIEPAVRPDPRPAAAERKTATRTIQFDTGRTRVIWVLDPSFEIGAARGAAR